MKPFDLYRLFQPQCSQLPVWIKTSDTGTISLSVQLPFGKTIIINWGDGTFTSFTSPSGQYHSITHLYSISGTKLITVSGNGVTELLGLGISSGTGFDINYIDVSNNTKLELLELDNNQFQTLKINGHPTLSALRCTGDTTITSIDVSGNTALAEIYCNLNSSLSVLDISGDSALTSIRCYSTALSSLDISENTELVFLNAGNCSFTSESINSVLATLVINAKTNGIVDLQSQSTGAVPTGQGITDKATLISRGWTVTTD